MAGRQQATHKGLYDRRCKGAALDIGDLVLVKKTAWKGRHRIQDRWESDEYQVIGQSNPGIPVYEVKSVAGDSTRVLQFSSSMPYLEESTPLIDNNSTPSVINISDSHDSVVVSDSSPDISSPIFSPVAPIPRRNTRSTRGKPPERYGKVYTFDTLVDMGSYFQCQCDYCTGK